MVEIIPNEEIQVELSKEELRTAQKTEALLRMKKLKFIDDVIKYFVNENKLYLSENGGILFWLDDNERKMVEEWEAETGNLVYHVIKNHMEFGLCYSFLYVSTHTEEWVSDNEYLEEGYPIAYVKNVDDDTCSEYGSIGIRPNFGGVARIW